MHDRTSLWIPPSPQLETRAADPAAVAGQRPVAPLGAYPRDAPRQRRRLNANRGRNRQLHQRSRARRRGSPGRRGRPATTVQLRARKGACSVLADPAVARTCPLDPSRLGVHAVGALNPVAPSIGVVRDVLSRAWGARGRSGFRLGTAWSRPARPLVRVRPEVVCGGLVVGLRGRIRV
jgi:hypothetical protein